VTTPTPTTDMRRVIAEGLTVSGLLPPYTRLTELNRLLRTELERLITETQAQADAMDLGTPEADSLHRTLRTARNTLADDLGPGLRSAALHVHALARHCEWLTTRIEGER
jgi:hypothetical protein